MMNCFKILALIPNCGYSDCVAANSATRFGDLIKTKAHKRRYYVSIELLESLKHLLNSWRFFTSVVFVMAAMRGRRFAASAGFLCHRFANLRIAATLICLATDCGSSSVDKGAFA